MATAVGSGTVGFRKAASLKKALDVLKDLRDEDEDDERDKDKEDEREKDRERREKEKERKNRALNLLMGTR